MSITDELREWAKTLTRWWYDPVKDEYTYTTGGMPTSIDAIRLDSNIIAIADRIDAAVEGMVELPKDADGEYIHVGDVMDSRVDYLFDGKPFTVRALVLCENGWEVADGRFGNRYEPDSLRHHHAPTVEDVLREFSEKMNENLGMYTGEAIDADEWRQADSKTIAEYAKRLRLAEGEDA